MKPVDPRAVEAGALAALASYPSPPASPATPRGADPIGWPDDFDRGAALARECVERACRDLPTALTGSRLVTTAAHRAIAKGYAVDRAIVDDVRDWASLGDQEIEAADLLVDLISGVLDDRCPDEHARVDGEGEEVFDDGQDAAPLLLRRLWRRDERGQFYIGEPPPLSAGVRVSCKRRGAVECVFGVGEVQVAWDDGTRSTEHGGVEVE